MRIFLTGATGYIGLAALDSLVRAGHEVTGLVRTPEKAQVVSRHGGRPLVGDLAEPASYREAASTHDGIVHAAEDALQRRAEVDRVAVETLLAAARAIRGGGAALPRFLIYTSGVWVLGNTAAPAAEDAALDPTPHVAWRQPHEQQVLDAAGPGLRTVVVRPGIIYGGSRGIVGDLIRDATNGLVRIVGSGENHWPAVYDRDLADLYVRLAARGDAAGIFHACDESDERVNEIVSAICAQMKVPPEVRRIPLEEARVKMGPYAGALALDQIVRCPRARALGWAPAFRSIARNASRLVEEWRTAD